MNRYFYNGTSILIDTLNLLDEWMNLLQKNYFKGNALYDSIDIAYTKSGLIKSFVLSFHVFANDDCKLCTFSFSGQNQEFQFCEEDSEYVDEIQNDIRPFNKRKSVLEEIKFLQTYLPLIEKYPNGEFMNYHITYDGYGSIAIIGDSYSSFEKDKFIKIEDPKFPMKGKAIGVFGMIRVGKNRGRSGKNYWHIVAKI